MLPGTHSGMMMTAPATVEFSHVNFGDRNGVSTSFTFASKGIGSPNANRYVVLLIGFITATSDSRSLQSATIGGVAATIVIQRPSGGSTYQVGAVIAYAKVPTGSNADIILNFSGSTTGLAMSVFNAIPSTGNLNTVATYKDRNTVAGDTVIMSTPIATVNNGVVFATSHQRNGLEGSVATGLTVNKSIDVDTNEWFLSSSRSTSGAGVSVKHTTPDTAIGDKEFSGVAASFGP